MTIAIGSDHAGFQLKNILAEKFWEEGIEVNDCGCDGSVCDYADIAKMVCDRVRGGKVTYGILVCGTGLGMSIAANKCKGIRAALCSETFSAMYARKHNDANVLCLGGRVLSCDMARAIVDAFIHADFEGGRHAIRVQKIMELENNK